MTEREALLKAVCDAPDDDLPRLVFADWLDEHGEPDRAEFIRVQTGVAAEPDSPVADRLRQRERELLTANAERWTEPFARFDLVSLGVQGIYGMQYHRGFVYGLALDENEDAFADRASELFQLAPIRRLFFVCKYQHERSARCPELLRLLELRTDRAGFEPDELRFLVASPFLRYLTRLELIGDDDNGHLDAEGLRLLANAPGLPGLRHLDLSHNWCNWLYEREPWIPSLLAGSLVSQLETLRLCGTFFDGAGAAALAGCPALRSLTHLDLSGNCIDDQGLRALVESPYLTRLVVLDLRENRCETEEGDDIRGCQPETRRLLEARFGSGLLIDGDVEGDEEE
jgi:uncharacterized protein (TIGR02996 family)